MLHAGPTLFAASFHRRFYITGSRRVIRSITCQCIVCRRTSARPLRHTIGQVPADCLVVGAVFQYVAVDYAGPLLVKYGSVCKPILVNSYVSVFVSLSVKAVHLELVSDLTTEASLAALRRFIARRGNPPPCGVIMAPNLLVRHDI